MASAPQIEVPDPTALVREDKVHRSVYTDPAIFALEMERIHGRAWLYLAHESEFKAAGDYVVRHLGTQAVILTRDKQGAIHGIFNRCSHRGATLCAFDRGSAPHGHQCPYHGWTFNADGSVRFVSHPRNYDGVLDPADQAIQSVRIESYRGFLFGNLAADAAPPLLDFMGHMKTSIDDLVDRSPTGKVECGPYVLRHYYRANWKMTFENLNDTIHPGFAHAASVVSARNVASALPASEQPVATLGMMLANGKPIQFFQDIDMVTAPGGHSYIGGHMGASYTPDAQNGYVQAMTAFHGAERTREILSIDRHLMLLYPSSFWHARYQTVRILRPVRHDLTEMIGFVFRLVGAPDETYANAVEYCTGANSAASPVIADDLEIYERCLLGNGFGDQQWIPMSRGLKETREVTNAFTRSPATSEAFIRNQFAAWSSYMAQA
ncbi:aromatic ring-hydroxylating oxygenase subunit alpha [Sphingobium algorifonticola]|nr:aromatic ring-hydroxylating dioxygenase subunit alpha [Sphingobium algorifonticola]